MKLRIESLFAGGFFALALFGAAVAGPLENGQAGQAAYQSGDYSAAMHYWRPLADEGDVRAQNLPGRVSQ